MHSPDDLRKALRVLSDALSADERPSQATKRRVVSIMAKNIQPGDLVDFPTFGEQDVSGWSICEGEVMISAGQYFQNFPADQRVRVVREVHV